MFCLRERKKGLTLDFSAWHIFKEESQSGLCFMLQNFTTTNPFLSSHFRIVNIFNGASEAKKKKKNNPRHCIISGKKYIFLSCGQCGVTFKRGRGGEGDSKQNDFYAMVFWSNNKPGTFGMSWCLCLISYGKY